MEIHVIGSTSLTSKIVSISAQNSLTTSVSLLQYPTQDLVVTSEKQIIHNSRAEAEKRIH
jgi:hypothetical protein